MSGIKNSQHVKRDPISKEDSGLEFGSNSKVSPFNSFHMVTNEYKDLNYKPIDMNFDNENEEQFFDGMEIILN